MATEYNAVSKYSGPIIEFVFDGASVLSNCKELFISFYPKSQF